MTVKVHELRKIKVSSFDSQKVTIKNKDKAGTLRFATTDTDMKLNFAVLSQKQVEQLCRRSGIRPAQLPIYAKGAICEYEPTEHDEKHVYKGADGKDTKVEGAGWNWNPISLTNKAFDLAMITESAKLQAKASFGDIEDNSFVDDDDDDM